MKQNKSQHRLTFYNFVIFYTVLFFALDCGCVSVFFNNTCPKKTGHLQLKDLKRYRVGFWWLTIVAICCLSTDLHELKIDSSRS
jgi:hypothetical protein